MSLVECESIGEHEVGGVTMQRPKFVITSKVPAAKIPPTILTPPPGNMEAPPLLEVLPTFTKKEKETFLALSSLQFNEFYCSGNPCGSAEKHVLFKANRVLEDNFERIKRLDQSLDSTIEKKFKLMLKWGHVSLLAHDYAKALSAYQTAYKLKPNEFWTDPGGYFGLGLVYMHFREHKMAAEAFSRMLYSYPVLHGIVEAKVRLAVCYQNLSEYEKALKFFEQALADMHETPFMTKQHIRFNIALSKENFGDLAKAEEEYKQLLNEADPNLQITNSGPQQYISPFDIPPYIKFIAAIHRQLGWIYYRQSTAEQSEEERMNRLQAAERSLHTAKELEPHNGKTFYFLGRCFQAMIPSVPNNQPPQPSTKAHDAFVHYRHSIDKSEADADTWCSIGWLYQQQSQPLDALQAFVCAVELDSEHSAAWTDLGVLYEAHSQFEDALQCFKNAVRCKSAAPEALKERIRVLEKELQTAAALPAQPQNRPAPPPPPNTKGQPPPPVPLPCLKEAWSQPIPLELRQRQEEFLKGRQQRYRDGSPLWRMGELAAALEGVQEIPGVMPLESTQMQMMKLLQLNKDKITQQEQSVLEQLESRYKQYKEATFEQFYGAECSPDGPKFSDSELDQVKNGGHLSVARVSSIKRETEDSDYNEVSPSEDSKDCLSALQDGGVSSTDELPATFSLESKIHVPVDISATELLEMCARRVDKPAEFRPVFDERVGPPEPPPTPPAEDIKPPAPGQQHPLLKPTPLVVVESRKDAQSPELQKFCEAAPIALIRGLTAVLKMDLSLFSTKTLRDTAPDHEVEVRTQYKMPCDLNVDHLGNPVWLCESTRSFTTVNKYAQYQAETFQHSLKEEAEKLKQTGAKYAQQMTECAAKRRRVAQGEREDMPMKTLKFGTNVDLSDETKWKPQLHELAKMPPFCRLIAGCNMLSHLGHTVLGMNTVQLYMKVPGSRTPAHQENNSFASININIGPGDCEWYGVPNEYWGVISKMCAEKNIDFLTGSYWPNVDDLLARGIPVYRFTQKAGDLVWVGGGCVHWVQATGWCNNIAWNVGPVTYQQLSLCISSYEYNKLKNYKSLVPVQHLCWQLAKNIRFTNQKIFTLIRGQLIRSLAFCKMVADWAKSHGKQLKPQSRVPGEVTHYCTHCEVEVFNILFVKEQNGKFPVFCVYCAKQRGLDEFIVLQQIPFDQLTKIFDEMQMNIIPKHSLIC